MQETEIQRARRLLNEAHDARIKRIDDVTKMFAAKQEALQVQLVAAILRRNLAVWDSPDYQAALEEEARISAAKNALYDAQQDIYALL